MKTRDEIIEFLTIRSNLNLQCCYTYGYWLARIISEGFYDIYALKHKITMQLQTKQDRLDLFEMLERDTENLEQEIEEIKDILNFICE